MGKVPSPLASQLIFHLEVLLIEVKLDFSGVHAGVLVARLLQALCQGSWPTEEHTNY